MIKHNCSIVLPMAGCHGHTVKSSDHDHGQNFKVTVVNGSKLSMI